MRKLIFLIAVELFAVNDFASYKANIMKEFNDYYEKEMREFANYMQTSDGIENKINPYQEIDLTPSKPPKDEAIKKEVVKKESNIEKDGTPSGSQARTVDIEKIDIKELVPLKPVVIAPAVVLDDTINIDFFGANIVLKKSSINFVKTIARSDKPAKIEESIGARSDALVAELKRYKKELNLNDFDIYLLSQIVVNNIYKDGSELERTVLMINIVRSLGYKVRLAEGKSKKPYILVATKQDLFSKGYSTKDNQKFYLFHISSHPRANFSEGIFFYNSPDDNKGVAMDMVMHKDPKIGTNTQQVELNWVWNKKPQKMVVKANRHLVDLMDMYPQVDYAIYMQSNSGLDLINEISHNLAKTIMDLDLKEEEAVNFVLRFAQSAFAYKTDFEAYGYERPFFVEQTILLPYSDCEDRATLLSKLYRTIFGYESVGLHYKGHVALAINYGGSGKDFYELNNRRYFVADGVYFYKDAGVSQPEFKSIRPKFLPTR